MCVCVWVSVGEQGMRKAYTIKIIFKKKKKKKHSRPPFPGYMPHTVDLRGIVVSKSKGESRSSRASLAPSKEPMAIDPEPLGV